ncbi:hypothetical protein Bca4012_037444 [Brassica carinata]
MFFFQAEQNDGEPVDELVLMKEAYTNKKTGEISDAVVKEVVDLVETQRDEEIQRLSQLQSDEDGTTAASTNLPRTRINELVESVRSSF